MKIILNGVPGKIAEIRQTLPNIGLGKSTATIGHEFVADPLPPADSKIKFEFDGNIVINGKKKKTYKAFRREGWVWIYVMTFSVPVKAKKDAVGQFFNEQEL